MEGGLLPDRCDSGVVDMKGGDRKRKKRRKK
jgi:hypothetical protein